MRNYSKTIGAIAAASSLMLGGTALAQLEGQVHAGYSNMYEFRFMNKGHDLIEAGADVAYRMGDVALSAGAWYGSFKSSNAAPWTGFGSHRTELDLYVAGHYNLGDLALEAGYIYKDFSNISRIPNKITRMHLDMVRSTQELYVGANYKLPFNFDISSTFYYDIDAYNGWYWENKIGYTYVINDCTSLQLSAGAAWAAQLDSQHTRTNPPAWSNWRSSNDGYQGFFLSAALPWEFRENATLTPYIKYTNSDSDLVNTNAFTGTRGKDYIIGGARIAVRF